jgi:quercetin dioxygenase-like cupin family protein
MRKAAIVIVIVTLGALSGLCVLQAQEKPAPAPTNMGGVITGGMVTIVPESFKASIARFRFDPGARTKWHTHEGGQIVMVEEGVGRTQIKGGPVIELKPGDVVYCPPGVSHWHGAAPDQGALQYNVSRGTTTFGDEVTDQEYRVAPKK